MEMGDLFFQILGVMERRKNVKVASRQMDPIHPREVKIDYVSSFAIFLEFLIK